MSALAIFFAAMIGGLFGGLFAAWVAFMEPLEARMRVNDGPVGPKPEGAPRAQKKRGDESIRSEGGWLSALMDPGDSVKVTLKESGMYEVVVDHADPPEELMEQLGDFVEGDGS